MVARNGDRMRRFPRRIRASLPRTTIKEPAMIETPYLLFLGDAPDPLAAKVAQGIRDWRPENAVGQFRMEGCKADLGLPDMTWPRRRRRAPRRW
jgi:hypothetical protein